MEQSGLLDLTIEEGATFTLPLTFEDEYGPIDLTGASARMQLRKPKSSSTIILNLTIGNGIEIDPLMGGITVTITDEQTTELDFRRCFYDLEIEYADGTVDRLLEGRVMLSREVTRVS